MRAWRSVYSVARVLPGCDLPARSVFLFRLDVCMGLHVRLCVHEIVHECVHARVHESACVCTSASAVFVSVCAPYVCVTASRVRGERKPVSVCVRATVCMCVCGYTCVCKYAVCVGVSLCLFVCVRVRQHVCV